MKKKKSTPFRWLFSVHIILFIHVLILSWNPPSISSPWFLDSLSESLSRNSFPVHLSCHAIIMRFPWLVWMFSLVFFAKQTDFDARDSLMWSSHHHRHDDVVDTHSEGEWKTPLFTKYTNWSWRKKGEELLWWWSSRVAWESDSWCMVLCQTWVWSQCSDKIVLALCGHEEQAIANVINIRHHIYLFREMTKTNSNRWGYCSRNNCSSTSGIQEGQTKRFITTDDHNVMSSRNNKGIINLMMMEQEIWFSPIIITTQANEGDFHFKCAMKAASLDERRMTA